MNDRITLSGVSGRGFHGVLAEEKRDGQTFIIDVVMELDLSRAGHSDDLQHTVNYAEVAADVMERITGPSFDLIERLAETIAQDVLARPLVDAVEVVVHKPEAPVGQPFSDVTVSIRREREPHVVIALGSNLGDRGQTLDAALAGLRATPGLRLTSVSPVVETDPVGGPEDQPVYLNAVAVGQTSLMPADLLARLHEIEADHGRTREVRWGARTLDLDLIQYGTPGSRDEVISDKARLSLPHPRAAERAFVLVPWSQADPNARVRVEAGDGGIRPIEDVLAGVDQSGVRPADLREQS